MNIIVHISFMQGLPRGKKIYIKKIKSVSKQTFFHVLFL